MSAALRPSLLAQVGSVTSPVFTNKCFKTEFHFSGEFGRYLVHSFPAIVHSRRFKVLPVGSAGQDGPVPTVYDHSCF